MFTACAWGVRPPFQSLHEAKKEEEKGNCGILLIDKENGKKKGGEDFGEINEPARKLAVL